MKVAFCPESIREEDGESEPAESAPWKYAVIVPFPEIVAVVLDKEEFPNVIEPVLEFHETNV